MKMLRKVLIVVLVVVVVALVVVYFSINGLVRKGIETQAGASLGVPVKVRGVSVNPFAGRVTIDGLDITNPEGYSPGSLLTVNRTAIQVNLGSLLSDKVTINDISVQGAVMTVEGKGLGTNVQTIMNSAKANSSSSEPSSKGYHIERVALQETTARFILASSVTPPVTVGLPDIEIKDLGTDSPNGVRLSTALLEVLGRLASEAATKAAGKVPGNLTNSMRTASQEAGKAVEGVLKGTKEGVEGVLKGVPKLPLGN